MTQETKDMPAETRLDFKQEPALALEPAPQPEQVMHPPVRQIPLALAVLGNVLVGLVLLGGLLLAPAMLSVLLLPA
jgi:hypothetical protein